MFESQTATVKRKHLTMIAVALAAAGLGAAVSYLLNRLGF